MRVSELIATRTRYLLAKKAMSQYRLEMLTGLDHSTMTSLLSAKNKGANIRTIMLICNALGITVAEFFDDPIFKNENIDLD